MRAHIKDGAMCQPKPTLTGRADLSYFPVRGRAHMRKLFFAALVLVGCNAPKDAMNRGTDNNGLNYPAGPYGYTKHAVMANLGFVVKEDPMLSQGTADYA